MILVYLQWHIRLTFDSTLMTLDVKNGKSGRCFFCLSKQLYI